MRRRIFIAGFFAVVTQRAWAVISPAERARIERLLIYIAKQKDTKFVRNGTAFAGIDAAKFLRAKLEKMGEHVSTAQQFIDQIASKSSTTGKPYLIRFADGQTVPAAAFLGDELKRMDQQQ